MKQSQYIISDKQNICFKHPTSKEGDFEKTSGFQSKSFYLPIFLYHSILIVKTNQRYFLTSASLQPATLVQCSGVVNVSVAPLTLQYSIFKSQYQHWSTTFLKAYKIETSAAL